MFLSGAQVPDITSGKSAPPTAQHALREGKVLGHNIAASIKGKPLKTFNFRTLGSLAALGHQLAVAEILGYRFSGFLAWLMWRTIYLSKLPTLEKQGHASICKNSVRFEFDRVLRGLRRWWW